MCQLMCSSRKYPYPSPTEGTFALDTHPPGNFILGGDYHTPPPTPWKFLNFSRIPNSFIELTNKNVALIYSVTICEQKTKDCACPSESSQHKLQHCCFYLGRLPSFIISLLDYDHSVKIHSINLSFQVSLF